MTQNFYDPFIKAMELSEKSVREIARETGISRSKLSDLGTKGRLYADEIPILRSCLSMSLQDCFGPEMFAHLDDDDDEMFKTRLDILAAQLVNSALSKAQKKLNSKIKTDDVVDWWESVGGKLTECDQLMTRITTFKAVETPDSPMIAIHVGEESLPRHTLNTRIPEEVTEYADSLDEDARHEIVSTYHVATKRRDWIIEPREMEIHFRTVENPFVLRHKTLALPTIAANGEMLVLSFSEFLSARPINDGSIR